MGERTKKILHLANEFMKQKETIYTENNDLTKELRGATNEGGTENKQPSLLPNYFVMTPVNECTSKNPQPTTSQHDSSIKQVTALQSDWVVGYASSTTVSLRKVEKRKYFSSLGSDSEVTEKLFSSGSSDEYEPSCSEDSSSDDSSAPLVPHRPIDNPAINDSDTETINKTKRAKKRPKNVNNWKKVKTKLLKNSGQRYTSRTGKTVEARKMGPPCKDKCVLSCSKNLTEEFRSQLFKNYWELCSLQRQRDFLISCIEPLILKYRRISAAEPRKPNCAFYVMNNDKKVRVCKTFLINTLGITERTIRTVIQPKVSGTGIAPSDERGKHNNQKKIPEEILNSIRNHINSIPRIESHYIRKDTSREYIDGGLTIAEMHRHYSAERSAANKSVANYDTYARIFNTEFNIGFFMPKKDQCDHCEAYKNAAGEEKTKLEETFREHQEEKELSRTEKAADKEKAKKGEMQLAVYDLQAVLPVPIGQTSAFFYKSRLNCFNFTVSIGIHVFFHHFTSPT